MRHLRRDPVDAEEEPWSWGSSPLSEDAEEEMEREQADLWEMLMERFHQQRKFAVEIDVAGDEDQPGPEVTPRVAGVPGHNLPQTTTEDDDDQEISIVYDASRRDDEDPEIIYEAARDEDPEIVYDLIVIDGPGNGLDASTEQFRDLDQGADSDEDMPPTLELGALSPIPGTGYVSEDSPPTLERMIPSPEPQPSTSGVPLQPKQKRQRLNIDVPGPSHQRTPSPPSPSSSPNSIQPEPGLPLAQSPTSSTHRHFQDQDEGTTASSSPGSQELMPPPPVPPPRRVGRPTRKSKLKIAPTPEFPGKSDENLMALPGFPELLQREIEEAATKKRVTIGKGMSRLRRINGREMSRER